MTEERKTDEQRQPVEWFRHGQTPLADHLRHLAEAIEQMTAALKAQADSQNDHPVRSA